MKVAKKTGKVVLLVLGLFPVLFVVIVLITLDFGERTKELIYIIPFFITAVSIPSVFLFYVVNVFLNKGVLQNQRYLWTALLFFGNVFVYPFYWYKHIWQENISYES